jgi:NAD(P)-dependent dehydrogenase (short-subunit alcohol dehydrogenase family)
VLRSIGTGDPKSLENGAAPAPGTFIDPRQVFETGCRRLARVREEEAVRMTVRTALVTGANRGLGRAVATCLRKQGCRVVVAARDAGEAAAVAAELGVGVVPAALDVTDPRAVSRLAADLSVVDILVNNAGVLESAGMTPMDVDLSTVEREIQVNTLGSWRVTQAFVPGMVARGWGRVVMVSSGTSTFTHGLFGGTPGYTVSKVGLNAVTALLAAETEGTGVQVNAVNPGLVRTRMRPDAERLPEEAAEDIAWVATAPDGSPSGVLFSRRKIIGW